MEGKTDDIGAHLKTNLPEQQQKLQTQLKQKLGEVLTETESLAWKEFGLAYLVSVKDALKVFTTLKNDEAFAFNMLIDVTCVDWLEEKDERFEIVYQLLSLDNNSRVCIKILVDEDEPSVDSVVSLWKSAAFMEREVYDMFGITFNDNGDMRRILMYDEFVGHPLRKDYPILKKQPRIELRVPELHNTSKDMAREQLVSLPVRQRITEN